MFQILDLYAGIYTDLLAIPVVKGRKSEKVGLREEGLSSAAVLNVVSVSRKSLLVEISRRR